jgi:hypothetical protein
MTLPISSVANRIQAIPTTIGPINSGVVSFTSENGSVSEKSVKNRDEWREYDSGSGVHFIFSQSESTLDTTLCRGEGKKKEILREELR